jgi:hypothetical protein
MAAEVKGAASVVLGSQGSTPAMIPPADEEREVLPAIWTMIAWVKGTVIGPGYRRKPATTTPDWRGPDFVSTEGGGLRRRPGARRPRRELRDDIVV